MAKSIGQRLLQLEDREAVRLIACCDGYAVDRYTAEAVGAFYSDNGIYAVGDIGSSQGREAIEAIARDSALTGVVAGGAAPIKSASYVVVEGNRAVTTCHTRAPKQGADGFAIWRRSDSRIEAARPVDGDSKIVHRQSWLFGDNPNDPARLGPLNEGPGSV